MNKIISVIIPCFNAEIYIDRCMQTVLNQTMADIEIIVIDDGSSDKTLPMLQEYAAKDNRIKVFTQQNGGQSSARNLGLDNATGNYISFIDIDDYVALDMLEVLYNNSVVTNSQISICAMAFVDANGNVISIGNDMATHVFDKTEALKNLLAERYILFSVCDKLYKRKIFDGIRFPVGVIHEDVLIPYELVKLCDSVCCSTAQKYFYCQNDDSTMTKKFTKARLNDITAREKIVSDVKQCYPELYDNSLSTKLVGYLNIIHKLIADGDKANDAILTNLIATLKADKKLYLNSQFISQKRKLGVRLITGCFPLYKLLYSRKKG